MTAADRTPADLRPADLRPAPRTPADLRPAGASPLFAGAAAVLLLLLLTLMRAQPDAPLPIDAPADRFAAARALGVLERILAPEQAHPVGSEAGRRVREAIAAELRALGLAVEVQEGFACAGQRSTCAPVVNLIARLPGRQATGAVLVSTHHDSVGAGPGAADAGASVAAMIEIARLILAGEPLARPVLLLFNDGEEAGLLGARAFFESEHAQDVFAVVNLEARGTTGPSALFETGPGNASFVEAWAGEVTRPVSSSTLYDLYTLIPNDTDLTVYKEAGWPGLNFAFAGGAARYHTPLDALAHLDPATLQHHGETALAAVRALASLPDSARGAEDAAWIDLVSATVVWWPQRYSLPLGLLALLLAASGTILAMFRGLARGGELGWALVGVALSLLLPLAAGEGLVLALQRLREDAAPWTAHPTWASLAVAATAAGTTFLVAALFARRAGAWAWWSAVALLLAGLGTALTWRLPGAAPHGLIPALALSASLTLSCALPRALGTLCLFSGLILAAWPWLSIGHALHVMMGLEPSLALSLPVAVLATVLSAALPAEEGRWRPALAALALAAIGWTTAAVLPRYSAELPRPANLLHVENADTGQAWWLTTGNPPPELAAALAAKEVLVPDFPRPGESNPLEAAPASASGDPPPELSVLSRTEREAGRRIRVRLRSLRGADFAQLRVPAEAGLRGAVARGVDIPTRPGRAERLVFRGLPREGLEIELDFDGFEPARIVVEDRVRVLPREAARLLQSRPPSAVPFGDGDLSVLYRRVELP